MKLRIALAITLTLAAVQCQPPQQNNHVESLVTKVDRVPWSSQHSVGRLLTTEHYRIHTTTKNPVLLNYLPGFMEGAYKNYLRLTGLTEQQLDKRFDIYMMGSREEWVLLTKNVMHAHRDIYLSIEAGGYCYKGVGVFWDLRGMGTFSTASHEGLHQFLGRRLKNHLPMWAEEGLCVSSEGHSIANATVRFTPNRNAFRFSSLRSAILEEYWLPLSKLLPLDGGDVAIKGTQRAVTYYAQLWAMSMFLRSHPVYRDGFERMIADAEAGRFQQAINIPPRLWSTLRGRIYNRTISEPLFRHYITADYDGFEREFNTFARRLAKLE